MKRLHDDENINLGFQIAPMIDVVFVIMLFFMVMAGAVKVEHELKTALPSSTPSDANQVDFPEDIIIAIGEDDTVALNDEEMDSSTNKQLPSLTDDLIRLRKEAEARGSKVLVTLQTEEHTKYYRIIDVLDALSRAKIQNVTFTVGTDDQ
jgi:biopolymer transport protein ExbD